MSISKFPTIQDGSDEQQAMHVFGDIIRKYRTRAKFNSRSKPLRIFAPQPVTVRVQKAPATR